MVYIAIYDQHSPITQPLIRKKKVSLGCLEIIFFISNIRNIGSNHYFIILF